MKVIKRDGRAVEYNREKIEIAIEKANKEVQEKGKINKNEIKQIIDYIEKTDKKRMLVEDIQDIIEQKLMQMDKYELAKKYIVYRYTRALVRKANTTDESILGLIRSETIEDENGDKNLKNMTASIQREYIAGEVSKDLTKRMLLPEKIVKAHKDGIIYFHDSEYFVQPICRNSFIKLEDMLEKGTVINDMLIETPKRFETACLAMSQIIENVASNQYGTQSIDIMCLGKYLRKSEEKLKSEELIEEELKQGIQIIKYQLNTLMAIHGQLSYVKIYINLEQDDSYLEENIKIIKEFLTQYMHGMKNITKEYEHQDYLRFVYILKKQTDNNENNFFKKYNSITEYAKKCKEQGCPISFITKKESLQPGTFSQGKVSINLAQIAIISEENKKIFWDLLDQRLEICYEALMCRHYALKGTLSNISPIHWQHGAIARLEEGKYINDLLYNENSTLSLGYIGMEDMKKIMKTDGKFNEEVIKYLQKAVQKWSKQTNIKFIIEDEF